MRVRLLWCAAILASAVSCEEKLENQKESNGVVITCGFDDEDSQTRTYLEEDSTTPLWSEGDQIAINDINGNTKTITLVSSGTPSVDQGVISSDHKTFRFYREESWSSSICAVYPAAAFDGLTGDTGSKHPVITFANQDGTFGKANITAAKTDGSQLYFKSAGAILKYKWKPMYVMNITIPFSTLKYSYAVSFSSDGLPELSQYAETGTETFDVVPGYDDGSGYNDVDIFIGVPPTVVPAGSEFVYRTASRGVLGTLKTTKEATVTRNKLENMPDIIISNDIRFSVSSSKKVCFSKGNLYCKRSSSSSSDWTWGFYENQYDMNSLNSGCSSGDRTAASTDTETDLLTWGKISTDPVGKTGGSAFVNWGTVFGANYSWSVLSQPEWAYLLFSRTASTLNGVENARYCKATVNNVAGLILFPDVWSYPEDVNLPSDSCINVKDCDFTKCSYTAAEWQKMEAAGAVFLPAAGDRSGSQIIYVGTNGKYWTSSQYGGNADQAYSMTFYYDGIIYEGYALADVNSSYQEYKYDGASVRLVTPASR